MKKGFTLIELLAVIVILAVIALISVPIILGIIEKSKKGSTEDSAYGIVEAANLYYATNSEAGVSTSALINKSDNLLKYKGKVDNFTLSYNDEGKIAIVVYNGKYCGYKYYNDTKITTGTVNNSLCYINDTAINPDSFLPSTEDLTLWVKTVEEAPTVSGTKNEIQLVNGINVTNYVIAIEEPTVKETGTTWIKLDTESSIYITMDNIYIPIGSIKQYNGTSWNSVDAYIYDGTSWNMISSKQYKEQILNGADPVLGTGMIPVIISNDGTVKYADVNSEWYNYTNKNWANAVILSSGTYNVGDTIPESAIQSYFVWIPRYKYKLWNVGTTSPTDTKFAINIKFGVETTSDANSGECTTPLTSGTSGNCDNGEYMTHPAFTSFNTNGIWVGKYETGYLGATSTATAQITSADETKIIVKPNVYSWRNNTIYNMFVSSYNYDRTNDSHMMKNTEWGAVTYLSNSIYGINDETNVNNNSNYITGNSALPTTNQQVYPGTTGDGDTYNADYNTEIGYKASTTGNISGIYDMSGGATEYMASYRSGTLGSSGFTTTTIATYDSKYFDVYSASSAATTYSYRILGDATGETGPFLAYLDADNASRYHSSWYGDYASFIESAYPWFHRGGASNAGGLGGQFYCQKNTGAVNTIVGSRLVLTQ
ncbi:MAG: type II secretion system protein [Bacilli bacterium]|nr:type II secretion system protein [Bacilli bacterium]